MRGDACFLAYIVGVSAVISFFIVSLMALSHPFNRSHPPQFLRLHRTSSIPLRQPSRRGNTPVRSRSILRRAGFIFMYSCWGAWGAPTPRGIWICSRTAPYRSEAVLHIRSN